MPAPGRHRAPGPFQGRRDEAARTVGASLIDPQTLMRIKSLQMRARVAVEGFFKGIHRSPYHGFSVEFSEYREYTPGDDPRYLDWRLYARSDRYYVKRFEDETNLRCHLVVDASRSMAYGSTGYTKGEYARTAAATRPGPDAPDFVNEWVSWGAGHRAGQSLVLGAKARALLQGRFHATPEDVRALVHPTLRHRVLLGYRAEADGVTIDTVIDRLIDHVKGPIR